MTLARTPALLAVLTVLAVPPCAAQQSEAWSAQIHERIGDAEYEVSPGAAEAWQSPNRSHGFRTYFLDHGIRVVPRSEERPSWELGFRLLRWGREGAWHEIRGARPPRPRANRVDYPSAGIVEWYVNDRKGLEHGFTIAERPEQVSPVAPLLIDLALTGTLLPRFSADGQAVEFVDTKERKQLGYSKLVVVDAAENLLPARIEAFSERGLRGLRLAVDDSRAIYPLEVDPLLTSASWTAEGVQTGADFGISVATAGDVNGDGYSDAVVGAPLYDNGESDEGRAFVFLGSASGLATTPAWTDESNQTAAAFGFSVATAGDVNGDGYSDVVVGCYRCDGPATDTGRVSVYHGSASGLPGTPSWTYDNVDMGERIGYSVAAAGDLDADGFGDLVAGAPFATDPGTTDPGRVYVFFGTSSGLSSAPTAITGTDGQLGFSVAGAGDINGDTFADIVAGAPFQDGALIQEGRVHVMFGPDPGSSGVTILEPAVAQLGARFGASVQTAGDINADGFADLAVGSPGYDAGPATDGGAAYVFLGSGSGIATTAQWVQTGLAGDRLGHSVSTAGDVNGDGYADVIVGAPFAESGEVDEGQAYLYFGTAAGLDKLVWTGEGNLSGAEYGSSVATAGDVNGDGYADVLVGAAAYENVGDLTGGAAFAYHGFSAGLSVSSAWITNGFASGDAYGQSVSTAGDVNGDGYADVIVGAPGFDAGFVDEGRAYVFHGSATGPSLTASWTADGGQTGGSFGASVATAGDVNNDGYSDVVVGVPGYDTAAGVDAGQARTYHGSPVGLAAAAAWSQDGAQATARFGESVAGAGDVDGDGFAEIVVGEPLYNPSSGVLGRSHLFSGSAGGLATTAAWTDTGTDSGSSRFGSAVAAAGDVNGDGFSDVLVGDPGNSSNAGKAYVYHGSATGLPGQPSWTASPGATTGQFGSIADTAGDVNGDGYADIFVGCDFQPSQCPGNIVYHGSAAGLSTTPNWQIAGAYDDGGTAGDVNGDGFADLAIANRGVGSDVWHGSAAGLGASPDWSTLDADFESVGTAGDVDGDGYADLIAGSPGYWVLGVPDVGAAFLYLGNRGDESDGHGVSLLPQQRRFDDAALVANLGMADDTTEFRIQMAVKTPFGRSRARLEKEVKPLGQLFDGLGTQAVLGYSDTNPASYNEIVTGLAANTVHHWRARADYDPVTIPLAPHGRWVTVPWNGWQEGDIRTSGLGASGAGAVPDDPDGGLRLERIGAGVRLSWGDSCGAGDDDYAVYVGTLGDFASHVPASCETGGSTEYFYLPPDPVDEYFLVVPVNTSSGRQGWFGNAGETRSPGPEICFAQELDECVE